MIKLLKDLKKNDFTYIERALIYNNHSHVLPEKFAGMSYGQTQSKYNELMFPLQTGIK